MFARALLMPLLLLTLTGCPTEEATDVCPDLSDHDSGQVTATLDGDGWEATDGEWAWQGSSLQVNTSRFDGWNLTIVAQTTLDGATVQDAVDAAVFPIEVRLRAGTNGGWAIFYPQAGDSYSTTTAEGGTMFLTAHDGGDLLGCFEFEAATDQDDAIEVLDGAMRIAQTIN
jgi:hypothetical protein